jgi:hypothetical protein
MRKRENSGFIVIAAQLGAQACILPLAAHYTSMAIGVDADLMRIVDGWKSNLYSFL